MLGPEAGASRPPPWADSTVEIEEDNRGKRGAWRARRARFQETAGIFDPLCAAGQIHRLKPSSITLNIIDETGHAREIPMIPTISRRDFLSAGLVLPAAGVYASSNEP